MCTAAHEPCTHYVPLGVTLHGSILKALRNLHKGTCLILLNLEQGFSDLNVYKIHEGILFKFRSVVGRSFCIFKKLPSNAGAAGPMTIL